MITVYNQFKNFNLFIFILKLIYMMVFIVTIYFLFFFSFNLFVEKFKLMIQIRLFYTIAANLF